MLALTTHMDSNKHFVKHFRKNHIIFISISIDTHAGNSLDNTKSTQLLLALTTHIDGNTP